MSKAFNSIKKGLQNAVKHAAGDGPIAKLHHMSAVDVKALRQEIGMTQPEFAATFRISLGTLRHWERGDRAPQGPALVLLHIIAKNPVAVLKAIRDS